MSRRNCSFLITSLLPALALTSLCAGANAEEAKVPLAQPMRWSDPATWPNQKVPVAGDKVTIGRDKDVVLDVSPPPLDGLSIDGKLSFSDDADLELTTEWIMLHGELAIGSEEHPHTRKATEISYFRDKDDLWVKLVVPQDPALPIRPTVMQATITVSRPVPAIASISR